MTTIPEPITPIQPEEVVQVIRAMRGRITDFTQISAAEAKSLARTNVDPRAIQGAINALDVSESVRSALGRSAADLRQEAELNALWTAVAEELEAMLRSVRTGVIVRRHRLGLTALQAYHICRQLARQKEHEHLLPHVAAMRQRFKGGRRQAKPVEGQPEPKPEPLAQSKQR